MQIPQSSRADRLNLAQEVFDRKEFQVADALCNEILAITPKDGNALILKGRIAAAQGLFEDAAEHFELAARTLPTSPQALGGLGHALFRLGRWTPAIKTLERAIVLDPDPSHFEALANCYTSIGRKQNATEAFRRAAELAPQSGRILFNFARSLLESDQREEALVQLKKSVERDPSFAPAHDLGAALTLPLGKFEEFQTYSRSALRLEPENPVYASRLILGSKVQPEDKFVLDQLERLLKKPDLVAGERILSHFALGKGFEDLGEFERATQHYRSGNLAGFEAKIRRGESYDRAKATRETDFILGSLPESEVESLGIRQNPSELPVLIVGMMRSGTTLVEQILSSHPLVGGAGEQLFWRDHGPKLHVDMVRFRKTGPVEQAGQRYVNLLARVHPGKVRVCDKLPQNYMALGLVHAVRPKARMIMVRRDSRDNCLSLFTTLFKIPPPFGYSAEEIAFGYQQFLRLANHWKSTLPKEQYLEVDYEDLTSNQERVSRRMVEFLGLEWDPQCLFPEKNLREVSTPSQWQVRQPIYATSSGRHQRFLPWLKEEIDLWTL